MVDNYQITNLLTEQQVEEESQIVRHGRNKSYSHMVPSNRRPSLSNPMKISSRAR